MRRPAFTLVELMVSIVIGAMVALTAAGAMRAISRSRQKMWNMVEGAAEARFVADLLARDLDNLSRLPQTDHPKLVGLIELSSDGQMGRLLLRVVGRTPGRLGEPEGDVYEVEYYTETRDEKTVLFRRIWPNPEDKDPPGGLLNVVAQDIISFEIRYFDGEDWLDEWSERMVALPELVEVNLTWACPESEQLAGQSRLVCFGRWPQPSQESIADAAQQTGDTL